MTMLRDRFRIAGFSVDPARNLVTGPEGETAIEPKVMDLLCVLAARPGHVFSRNALIDLVWGTAFGADESLTRAVSQLRKTLGDSREEPRIVETISKRGYRLIAPVTPQAPAPAAPFAAAGPGRWIAAALLLLILVGGGFLAWRFAGRGLAARHAAAVEAPAGDGATVTIAGFATESGDQADLARRLRDGLITDISRDSLIHVRSRPSAAGDFRYVVQGAIEKLDGRIRVNVRLLDPVTGNNLWAENFDRADGAGVGDELTSAIAAELVPQLLVEVKAALVKKPLLSLKPWQLNLLATWIPGSDEVFLAPHTRDAFWPQRHALELDPHYAPAHATLASGLAYHALFSPAEDTAANLAEARRHAEIAVAARPFDPQVLYEIGTYDRFISDRAGAIAMLRRVLEIAPDNIEARTDLPFVEGQCDAGSGTAISSLQAIGKALSPANPIRRVVLSHLADLYLARGDWKAARDAAFESRAIVQSTWSGITLAAAEAELGQADQARAVAAETRLEWPGLDFGWFAARRIDAWCIGGAQMDTARRAFERLAALEKAGRAGR